MFGALSLSKLVTLSWSLTQIAFWLKMDRVLHLIPVPAIFCALDYSENLHSFESNQSMLISKQTRKSLQLVPILSHLIFKTSLRSSPARDRKTNQPPCVCFLGAVVLSVTVSICHVFLNEEQMRACFYLMPVMLSKPCDKPTEHKAAFAYA